MYNIMKLLNLHVVQPNKRRTWTGNSATLYCQPVTSDDRGYEALEEKLASLGAAIKRV